MEILSILTFQAVVVLAMIVVGGLGICVATARSVGTHAVIIRSSRFLLACTVLGIIIVSFVGPAGIAGLNLVPFRSIYSQWNNINSTVGLINLVGNVVMYVPLGLFVVLSTRVQWPWCFLVAIALSIGVEVAQQFTGRSSDIDDVILNAVGAVIGIAAGFILRKQMNKRNAETLPSYS